MSINKPYHRMYREFIPSNNSGYSSWAFIVDKEYAKTPHHYTRGFLILQEDIKNLFEYIEPADINLTTFSYRIHELLMRTCIEIEANFKAILRENTYTIKNEDYWNITDYKKINQTHHLDNYFVEFPFWRGTERRYQPFLDWQNRNSLSWYQAYNSTKHNKNENFEQANFKNLINAFAGLFVLLSSQFNTVSFTPGSTYLSFELDSDSYFEGDFGIGDYLKIEFPHNWTIDEKYDFDWAILKNETIRFEKFDYNSI